MAAGCEAKAKEMNWKMNICIVDSGANQIFFEKNGRRLFGQW
jgi:Haem-degrading